MSILTKLDIHLVFCEQFCFSVSVKVGKLAAMWDSVSPWEASGLTQAKTAG